MHYKEIRADIIPFKAAQQYQNIRLSLHSFGTATDWHFIQIHIKQKWYFPN